MPSWMLFNTHSRLEAPERQALGRICSEYSARPYAMTKLTAGTQASVSGGSFNFGITACSTGYLTNSNRWLHLDGLCLRTFCRGYDAQVCKAR